MKKQIQKTGKAAVDAENQINMANYRQVEEFCVKAGEGENTETTIFTVLDKGGFVRYDMEAENGGIQWQSVHSNGRKTGPGSAGIMNSRPAPGSIRKRLSLYRGIPSPGV